MGRLSDMMIEADERGYDFIDDITVCSDCVEEYALKSFIDRNKNANECSYCENKGGDVAACDFELFVGHIVNSIQCEWGDPNSEGLPYETREGGWQGNTTYTYDLLSELGVGDSNGSIFDDVCGAIHNDLWCEREPYSLTPDRTLMYGWKGFCEFVINTSRYVFFKAANENYDVNQHDEMDPVGILDSLANLVTKHGLIKTIPETTMLKRIRIVALDVELNTGKELGSPPSEYCTMANRMSPAGISMFYGAFDIKTAIKETYEPEEKVTKKGICGNFFPVRELTMIDLSERLYIPSIFDEEDRSKRAYIPFLIDFIKDFTKPIDRTDRAHVDYVPTQIVTEYFRHVLTLDNGKSVDGVIYPSSKNEGEKAVVIFADSEQCKDENEESKSEAMLLMKSFETISLND